VFGGRWESYMHSAPQTLLAVMRGWEYGGERKRREEREGVERHRNGKGKGGSGRGDKVGKGEGRLDLDICPGVPEFLVTPLGIG